MKTKYFTLLFLSLLFLSTTCFANIVLENQTSHPIKNQKSKIAIQWATSAKEVDEANKAIIYGTSLNPATFQYLTQSGKTDVKTPEKAEYFRVLVWSKGEGEPDLLTNWVDIVPDKTYTLKPDYLVPSVLMSGTGC
jgi:hypothetical protein